MTKLTFSLDVASVGDLPVEVRKPNMALVARTVVSESHQVQPGVYFVTTRLPDGDNLTERVTVTGAEPEMHVQIRTGRSPDLPQADFRALSPVRAVRSSRSHGIRSGHKTAISKGVTEPPIASATHMVEIWTGNVLAGSLVMEQGIKVGPGSLTSIARIHVEGTTKPKWAHVLPHRGAGAWMALPAWAQSSCDLLIDCSTEAAILIRLEHEQANLLLQLQERQETGAAEAAARAPSLTAERLLREKRQDPVAAVVGGYALLRFNDLERLHDWTDNLHAWFPELPDAAVLRAEHLARLAKHSESLVTFLKLTRLGLPLFAEGTSLALGRLRLYTAHGQKLFTEEQLHLASSLMRSLQRAAEEIDFSKPVTTLAKYNPERAFDEEEPEVYWAEDGVIVEPRRRSDDSDATPTK